MVDYVPGVIKHKSDKARQEFIMDCVFVNVGISVLYVALYENEIGGRTLHRNRERKVYDKMKESYKKLEAMRGKLYKSLCERDINTVKAKTDASAVAFINYVSTSEAELSLEILAVAFIDAGIDRIRRFEPYDVISQFQDFDLLYSGILGRLEAKGIRPKVEYDVAANFVSKVKY